jgi:hypothetical protein
MTRLLRIFRALCLMGTAGILIVVAGAALLPVDEHVSSNSDDIVWRHLTATSSTTTPARVPALRLAGATGPVGAGGGSW